MTGIPMLIGESPPEIVKLMESKISV